MQNNKFEYINERFLSTLSDEPKQILQPISGYADQPVLTIEEACEPLLSLVPRLEAHIWVAKQNSKNPPDGLTQDESAAVRLYTMEWDSDSNDMRGSLYANLNRTLKQVDRTKLRPWFRYLKLFLTALAKLPCAPRQTVWRGVRKNQSEDYPPGAEATWWAFSSCTKSLSVLESDLYLGNVGTRTLFSIEVINGREIRAHSHFATEDEVLLLPGTFFQVKSRLNPAPDLYIVHLQQIIPPHDLLEPPFEGAQWFPTMEGSLKKSWKTGSSEEIDQKPWYRRRRFIFGALFAALLSIFIILLATLLGIRKNSTSETTLTTTVPLPDYNKNMSIFSPASVAYAFYPFDYNTLDLYCLRDGFVDGGPVSYVEGFLPTGKALFLDQLQPSRIQVIKPFNLSTDGFTLQMFIKSKNNNISSSVLKFSSDIALNIQNGLVEFVLSQYIDITTYKTLQLNEWQHLAVVYDSTRMYASIFVDGRSIRASSYITLTNSNNKNITLTIGNGFQGSIDQLAISQKAKSEDQILWDATVAVYYPLDGQDYAWLLDYGPNVVNASSGSVSSVKGKIRDALNFTRFGSFFQTPALTPLTMQHMAITIAFWLQLSQPSGIILTVANLDTCLLVLGVRDSDQRLVVYLPNATKTNTSVTIIGSAIAQNRWAHIAFSWSNDHQAQLYRDTDLDGRDPSVVQLHRMTMEKMFVTLGMYRGKTNCVDSMAFNTTSQFIGAVDELYVFSRELTSDEIQTLSVTTYR